MEFSPANKIVGLCIKGIDLEEKDQPEKAYGVFLQAWDEAENDFERFIAAHHVARLQKTVADKLHWSEAALELARKIDNDYVRGAYSSLYARIADYYQQLGDEVMAGNNEQLSIFYKDKITDKGPFYHGTKAVLQAGELLTAGFKSNYDPKVLMNHIYFTAQVNGAGLAADLVAVDAPGHVYIVEPTGSFENDPNVTDKKFPGNPTRSYRSQFPLKVIGEVTDWVKMSPEQISQMRARLAANKKAEIIN